MIRLLIKLLFVGLILNALVAAQTADQCPSCTVIGGHLVSGGHVTLGNFGGTFLNPGFTWIQDPLTTMCTLAASSCTVSTTDNGANVMYPTSANTAVMFVLNSDTNTTITNITGGSGGTFTHCSTCHANTSGHNTDIGYMLGLAAGATSFALTFSGGCGTASTGFCGVSVAEVLPPASGIPIAFDVGATATQGSSTTLTGAAISPTQTDAVFQFCDAAGILVQPVKALGAWSGNFFTDSATNAAVYLNAPPGAISAPTLTLNSASGAACSAIAWKSAAGGFTVPTPVFSFVNYDAPNRTSGSLVTCSPACPATTISANAAGDLVFVVASSTCSASCYISSISPSASWNIPTGCRTISNSNAFFSCAWTTALGAGTTSITVTLTSNTNATQAGVADYQFHRTSGSWTLDSGTPQTVTNTVGTQRSGAPATLVGTNDVIIACMEAAAGMFAPTLFPVPSNGPSNTMAVFNEAECNVLLNSTNGAAETWQYPGENGVSAGFVKIAWQ